MEWKRFGGAPSPMHNLGAGLSRMGPARGRRLSFLLALVSILGTLLLGACRGDRTVSQERVVPGGDPTRGAQAIVDYGCGSCHRIPGVRGADALVGPPLDAWAERQYIAGNLPNTAENLIFWIQFPQSVEPGTAMPDQGVTEQDARDISAYLFSLQRTEWWDIFGGSREGTTGE